MYPPNQAPDGEEEDQLEELADFVSPKLNAKKRKAEVIEVDENDRVVRSIGRKDRHSKVRTARGPKDRRVRLSPRTAIQFYDVQDRLGYDRPSKAIDWLIKEAKTAIDALYGQPINIPTNAAENLSSNGGFFISECGKHDYSFFVDENAASYSTELQQDLNLSKNYTSAEASEDVMFYPNHQETNWEMARLQKMINWNYGGGTEYSSINNSVPVSGDSYMFFQREPLQSSIITDFQEFNFCNELSDITAAANLKNEDEKDKKLV